MNQNTINSVMFIDHIIVYCYYNFYLLLMESIYV